MPIATETKKHMSDRPPQPPLTEAERDAILRDALPILRDLRTALTNFNLQSNELKRLGGVAKNHEERSATLEDQVLAGVHSYSSADLFIPVTVEEPRVDHLSPPPEPMRGPMSTHEQLEEVVKKQAITALKTDILDKKQDAQTTILQKISGQNGKIIATFVGAILMAMVSNCNPETLQKWMPHKTIAPTPAMTAAPSPATSR